MVVAFRLAETYNNAVLNVRYCIYYASVSALCQARIRRTSMIKKLFSSLTEIPATIVSGIFMLLDLIPHVIEEISGTEPAFFAAIPFEFSWITIIISGTPLVYLAISRLINNKGISKISSALLISIAMFAAIAIGDIFAAGEVAFIMALGEILEDLTTDRAKKGLKKLIGLVPTTGRRITESGEEIIPAENINVGDVLRILPGETIPVDGVIISGNTSVDQSVMTGESLPVDKSVGDGVFCGTINRFGAIDITATKIGEDSSLGKLIRMVREAEDKQAPMQRIADKWASYLVPVALLLAVIFGLIKQNIVVAVTVLVVFCPCALVLATPTAIMAAIGQATKYGVIIKSGEALEKMGKVDTVAFDKTGTLTYGKLEVSDVISVEGSLDANALVALVASAESKSEHPLGKAIVEYARFIGISFGDCDDFSMESGKGIRAVVGGRSVLCGSEAYLNENGITLDADTLSVLDSFRSKGKASVIAASDGKILGAIALSDTLRPESSAMIANLNELDVKSVLLTGDNSRAASHFAEKVGISDVRAELLPDQKVEAVEGLRKNGSCVAMIGDGVNDAPALKMADVGIAMGGVGSDIAIEAADIALIGDDISKLPYLKKLSNATMRTIKFGITLSLIINFVAIVLSFLQLLTPTTGALVHNAGSCLVVLIAALLYDRKFD